MMAEDGPMAFECFSLVASDWIRLRLALYGPEDAAALMQRCFRRSRSDRINERTVLAAWSEQDASINSVLNGARRRSSCTGN